MHGKSQMNTIVIHMQLTGLTQSSYIYSTLADMSKECGISGLASLAMSKSNLALEQ